MFASPVVRGALGVLGVAGVAGILSGCAAPSPDPAPGPGIDRISAVDFRQTQAIEGFDDAEYTQDDPAEIGRFVALLDEHGIDPAHWRGGDRDCDGSRVTTATIHYADSELGTQLRVDTCNDDAFEQAADELFTQWREELAG